MTWCLMPLHHRCSSKLFEVYSPRLSIQSLFTLFPVSRSTSSFQSLKCSTASLFFLRGYTCQDWVLGRVTVLVSIGYDFSLCRVANEDNPTSQKCETNWRCPEVCVNGTKPEVCSPKGSLPSVIDNMYEVVQYPFWNTGLAN